MGITVARIMGSGKENVMICPYCKIEMKEKIKSKGEGKKKTVRRMMVCPKCGCEKFPVPEWGSKNGRIVKL